MNIFLTAGHQVTDYKKRTGTGANFNGRYEGFETRMIVNDVKTHLELVHMIPTFTEPDTFSLRETIEWLGKNANSNDLLIDFHFNAANQKAHGTEVFVENNYTMFEKSFGIGLSQVVANAIGTRDRGLKTEKQSQHDTLGILSGKTVSKANNILLELEFIDNIQWMSAYDENYLAVVEAISNFIQEQRSRFCLKIFVY